MKKLVITAGTAALLSLGAFVLPATAQAQVGISVQIGPPPPVQEVVPAPRPGYVWAPGHYEYNHNRYEWRKGNWMAERPGYAYHSADWVERNGRWYYSQGRWDHDEHRAGRPDQVGYDRDHDRDRDGVPNKYDHRPDDPRRQ